MTKFPNVFYMLASEFEQWEVKSYNSTNPKTRVKKTVWFVSRATIQNRFDTVLGPENWWPRFTRMGDQGVLCEITIRLVDHDGGVQHITKGDTAVSPDEENRNTYAFKRAAQMFGVGRYLKGDGCPQFYSGDQEGPVPPVPNLPQQHHQAQGRREAPREPAREPSQPARDATNARRGRGTWGNGAGAAPAAQSAPAGQPDAEHHGPPRTGRALFAWTKEQEANGLEGLLKYLNGWAKLQEFPGRMVDWDDEQVAKAHAEARRKIALAQRGTADAYEDALAN